MYVYKLTPPPGVVSCKCCMASTTCCEHVLPTTLSLSTVTVSLIDPTDCTCARDEERLAFARYTTHPASLKLRLCLPSTQMELVMPKIDQRLLSNLPPLASPCKLLAHTIYMMILDSFVVMRFIWWKMAGTHKNSAVQIQYYSAVKALLRF